MDEIKERKVLWVTIKYKYLGKANKTYKEEKKYVDKNPPNDWKMRDNYRGELCERANSGN